MAKNIEKLYYKYEYKDGNIEGTAEISLDRFEGQYTRAQFKLDSIVMTNMIPYMPMDTGQFINVTKAMSASIAGSGKVYAAAPPFGRYLYNGQLMVDSETGSPFARKGAKKVLLSEFGGATSEAEFKLQFSTKAHPKAQEKWFEAAKKDYGAKWINRAKRIAGGNK